MKKVLVVVLCAALFFGIPVSASESGNRHDRQGQMNNAGKQDAPSEEEIATMVSAYEEKNPRVKAIEVKIKDMANKFGTNPDYEALLDELMVSFENGEKKASRYVGLLYELGLGTETDLEKAAHFYENGIEKGDLTCSYYLGLLYLQGNGVDQDYEKAADLFASIAGSDNKSATGVVAAGYELAMLYEQGLGVDQDLETAEELYGEAAGYGNEDSVAALERLKRKE